AAREVEPVALAHDAWRERAVARGQAFTEDVVRLDHVAVGVDDPGSIHLGRSDCFLVRYKAAGSGRGPGSGRASGPRSSRSPRHPQEALRMATGPRPARRSADASPSP